MPIYKANGKNKDGLQKYFIRINYIDNRGEYKQLTRTAYGKENAKDLEQRLQQELKEETLTQRLTVQQLYEEYIEVKKFEVREATLDRTKHMYKNHISALLGGVRIDKLTAKVLQDWKTSIENKGLSLKTKKNIFSELRTMLNYAVKLEYIPKNPLQKVGNFKDALAMKQEMDFYTPQEFKQFIEVVRLSALEKQQKANDLSEWDYYVFFNIAFYTGLRRGEIFALKWSDIADDILSVRRSISQTLKGEDRETPPKNNSSVRVVQLPLPLMNILQEHKERQKSCFGSLEDLRICGGEQCIRNSSLQKKNIAYAEQAEVKRIRIHDFRHSHASLLVNNGVNIQEVARRLGHAKIEMTWNTYSHLYPREQEKAVDVLNAI